MDKRTILRLRVVAQKLKPSVHVGKDGVTSKVLEELRRQLKKNKIVKVRVLQSFDEDRKTVADRIASETHSALVDVRGSTIVLAALQNGQT